MIKLFIATPAYDGKVNAQFAISLAETYCELNRHGVQAKIELNTSGSLLVAERNRIAKAFLDSDCTHILCIDSDLGWPWQAVLALLQKDVDFVAGCYPARKTVQMQDNIFLFRPMLREDGSIIKSDKNLLAMEYIPAGFMIIKRAVFEKLRVDNPQLYFKPRDPSLPDGYSYFNTEVFEGEFWGEDYAFCRLVRKSGFTIWVDPCIEFDHAGTRGMLLNVLTDDKAKAQVLQFVNPEIKAETPELLEMLK